MTTTATEGTLLVEPFVGPPAEWDGLVRRTPGWTACHRIGWWRIAEEVYGHEGVYLCARSASGDLEGVLPMIRMKGRLSGSRLVSMPFLNYGGPLGSDVAVRRLCDAALRLARADPGSALEIRSLAPLPLDLPHASEKVTAVLDLSPGEPERVWSSFSSKLRSQIRRASRDGVTVKFGVDQVEPFFEVFSRHMTHLGTPTHPLRFFRAIAERFGDEAWFGCAYHGGQAIASGCCLVGDGEVEITWASALARFKHLSANMWLYWSFMERAAQMGYRRFNFGRCTPGSGSHRFKLQWSPREIPLWWYRDGAGEMSGTAAAVWGPLLWRRLPVPVARVLGPRIRGSISL